MNRMTLTQWLIASMAIMPLKVGNAALFSGSRLKSSTGAFYSYLLVFHTPHLTSRTDANSSLHFHTTLTVGLLQGGSETVYFQTVSARSENLGNEENPTLFLTYRILSHSLRNTDRKVCFLSIESGTEIQQSRMTTLGLVLGRNISHEYKL